VSCHSPLAFLAVEGAGVTADGRERQSLLTIVPISSSIEVQAMIKNQDIDFVEVGSRR
jgi:hypothetical protein